MRVKTQPSKCHGVQQAVLRGKSEPYKPTSGNRKISNKPANLTPKKGKQKKEKQTKPNVSRRKEIMKSKPEIYGIGTKNR